MSARDIDGLVARLQHIRRDGCYCADKPNKASLLHPVCQEAASALLALKAENDGLLEERDTLRQILRRYGDRVPMAMCHNPVWQNVIDDAMQATADNRAILRGCGEAG